MSFRRLVLISLAYVLLVFCETGFFASLPAPLRYTPLTFAVGIYLLQSRGWWPAVWLLAGFGFFLDVSGIAPFPLQTMTYAAAGGAAYAASRVLFSNRSLYGILGCGAAAWGAHALVQTGVWVFQILMQGSAAPTAAYAAWLGWRALLLGVLLIILFYLTPRRTRLPLTQHR